MLARILHVYGIPAIIYEAEPSPEARRQGVNSIYMKAAASTRFQEAGLSDEFRAIIHRGGRRNAHTLTARRRFIRSAR